MKALRLLLVAGGVSASTIKDNSHDDIAHRSVPEKVDSRRLRWNFDFFGTNNNDNDATQDDEEAPTETNDRENKPRRPSDTTNNNGPPTQPPGQRPAILWRPIPAASSPTNDNDESPTITNSGGSVPWAPQIGTTTEPPSKRPSNAPTKVSRYYSLIEIYHSCRHSSFPPLLLIIIKFCVCVFALSSFLRNHHIHRQR